MAAVADCANHRLETVDICDAARVRSLIFDFAPDALLHLAAESHVDHSINGPAVFMHTNILGTYALLEAAKEYSATRNGDFRFIHVSTDEVYGALGATGAFTEASPYRPNSPYSASKAASDHLVRAWATTYGVPTIITNCSNNYGPYQFPRKAHPGDHSAQPARPNLRPFTATDNRCGIGCMLKITWAPWWRCWSGAPSARPTTSAANCEKTNLEVAKTVLTAVAELTGANPADMLRLIEFVPDRPGHDRRYAIDSSHIQRELGWRAQTRFQVGIRQTVAWYLDNRQWWSADC